MNDLFQSIHTKEALEQYLLALQKAEEALYTLRSTPQEILATSLDNDQLQQITSYFIKTGQNLADKGQFSHFVSEMVKTAKTIPVLALTLSFHPTASQIEKIADWLAQNTTTHYLLVITIKPEILGGSLIGLNGNYKDFSVAHVAKKYFQQHANPLQREIKSNQN